MLIVKVNKAEQCSKVYINMYNNQFLVIQSGYSKC